MFAEWGDTHGERFTRLCDEPGDCGPRQRCCAPFAAFDGVQKCADWCDDHEREACLPGSRCPGDRRCLVEEGALQGHCSGRVRPVGCGARACAIDEVCCWNEATNQSRCVAEAPDERSSCAEGEVSFGCADPKDCASHTCVSNVGSFFFCDGISSYPRADANTVLCRSDADCGSLQHHDTSPTHCQPGHFESPLPGGLKSCF